MHYEKDSSQALKSNAGPNYLRNMYQKSSPCISIRKWSTIRKYPTQIATEIIPYRIFCPIISSSSDRSKTQKIHTLSGPELAGALNASKPIEKPQTHRASDVENHLADLNHQIAVCRCRRHLASPSMLEIVSEVCEFLDTPKPVCYSKFLSWRP